MIGLLSSLFRDALSYFFNLRYVDYILWTLYAVNTHIMHTLDQVVIFRDGTYLTLKEVFKSLDLTG